MALPSTGTISMGNVAVELGLSATTNLSLNDSRVRKIANIASGTISMSDLRGKSVAAIATSNLENSYESGGFDEWEEKWNNPKWVLTFTDGSQIASIEVTKIQYYTTQNVLAYTADSSTLSSSTGKAWRSTHTGQYGKKLQGEYEIDVDSIFVSAASEYKTERQYITAHAGDDYVDAYIVATLNITTTSGGVINNVVTPSIHAYYIWW